MSDEIDWDTYEPTVAVRKAAILLSSADSVNATCFGWVPQAREAIGTALDAADLETLTFRHRRLESDMWHCACGVRVHNVADHSNHQAAMIRAALLGADS